MKILYISTRIPFPPTSGDRLLIYNRAVKMHKKHKLDLITFYQDEEELKELKNIKHLFKNIWTVKVTKVNGFVNILRNSFICSDPFQVMYYNSPSIRRRVDKIINNEVYDLIDAYLIRTVPYINQINTPVVLDLIDSMQLNFLNRVENAKSFIKKIIYKVEYNRLVKFEKSLPRNIDKTIVVSGRDGAELLISSKTIPLGVDTKSFYPSITKKNQIIFSGNMSYEPNVQAVVWFVENCFDKIKLTVKDVVFIIAGRDPVSEIKNLETDSIIVTGYVDSIAELISESLVAIVPMVSGSGMQNKLIEAMSCGIPVVSTSYGVGDVKVSHMKEVLISDSALDFSNQVSNVLLNPKGYNEIALNGREFVVDKHSWDSHVDSLIKVYTSILGSNKRQ